MDGQGRVGNGFCCLTRTTRKLVNGAPAPMARTQCSDKSESLTTRRVEPSGPVPRTLLRIRPETQPDDS